MVFMNDERDVDDLRLFHETASRPNQTVMCVYDTEHMADTGFRQISTAIAAFAKWTKYREMLMQNGTQIFFTTRERMRHGHLTRGRENVTVIG